MQFYEEKKKLYRNKLLHFYRRTRFTWVKRNLLKKIIFSLNNCGVLNKHFLKENKKLNKVRGNICFQLICAFAFQNDILCKSEKGKLKNC